MHKPCIFIADHDPTTIEQLVQAFPATSYAVEMATDGEDAWNRLLASPPDLILLDLLLPTLSGFEICRRIKRNKATQFLPIVITTPLSHLEDKLKGIEFGADDFLPLPINRVEFVTRIKSLLHMKSLHDDLDSSENILFSLVAALEAKDSFTRGHSERVAALAVALGAELGLSDKELGFLHKGGLLHDIGKIGIKESVLLKPEKLTDDEMDHIKTHPAQGYDICARLKSIGPCLPIIRSHHERLDGKGYPDGLLGEDIPRLARITAIADAYDAMTHSRPYRQAIPPEKALQIFAQEKNGGQWDPAIVECLLDIKGGW